MQRTFIIIIHDVVMVALSLPAALMLREQRWPAGAEMLELVSAVAMLTAVALTAALVVGTHRALWRRLGRAEITTLVQFVGLALTLFYLGQFVVDRLDGVPRSAPILQFMIAIFGLTGSRLMYEAHRGWRRPAAVGAPAAPPVLLAGAGDGATLVIELLRQHPADGEPVGILCDNVTPMRRLAGVPVLGRLNQFESVLERLNVQGMRPTRLIITRPHHELGRDHVYDLVERASAAGLQVDQLPDVLRLTGTPGGPSAGEIGDATPSQDGPARKRPFDVAFAALALLTLSPLLGAVALAVALGIQRPVLFTQVRPGRHRRPYKLFKFRTMRDPLDAAGRRLSDAERTPWVGRLLRRVRIDELPQLWNVVRGEMALIGPRPLLAADLDAMPDGGRTRSAVRPGITGWAQVNGGHQLTPEEKLALDNWYAANADLKLDLLIVWRTLLMMLCGERRRPDAIAHARPAPAAEQLAGAD